MADRIGTGLVFVGAVGLVVALYTVGWEPTAALFERAVVFQASIFAISLGVGTLVVDPETTTEVLSATGLVVLGYVFLTVAILIVGGTDGDLRSVLLLSVIPYAPMVVGFTAGALRTVHGLSIRRRRRIGAACCVLGLLVWFGSYQLFVLTHDTTGESGFHPGFLLIMWVGILVGDLVVAAVLYLLWRLFGPTNVGASDRGVQPSNSTELKR